MISKFAFPILLLLAIAHSAGAHEAGGHDHGRGASGARAMRPGLAAAASFDSQGNLWSVSYDGQYLVVRRSADFGREWSPPVRLLSAPEPMDTGGDAKPNIAVGPDGELYVTWTRPLSKPYTGEIKFVRSIDGGKTFSAPRVVHADRQEITHRFDAMTVTRDGRLLVAWIDKRDGVVAGGKASDYAGAAVYYAVSDDRGVTFRGDYKVADHSCECCRIALLPQADGSVLGLWRHVFSPNVREHALASLGGDGKVSGFRQATFDDWRVDVCPHHGPSLGADAGGNLHAVWYTGAKGKAGVYYGRLEAGGIAAQQRVGGETAEHADLAAVGDQIAIVWKEFDGQRATLHTLRSSDRGATFIGREIGETADASDQPRLLAFDGKFHVFWNTRNEPLRVIPLP